MINTNNNIANFLLDIISKLNKENFYLTIIELVDNNKKTIEFCNGLYGCNTDVITIEFLENEKYNLDLVYGEDYNDKPKFQNITVTELHKNIDKYLYNISMLPVYN
jgi:hypothetical protein